jgi:hypothetical protein
MTKKEWQAFEDFREAFKARTDAWRGEFAEALLPLQRESAQSDTPEYPVETPVVYNTALDDVSERDEIKIILIGDNPGKEEQRQKNRRYLVGQSGKIADGFFKKNPALGVDFRKNVIILNKTPVHTAKTKHLRHLLLRGGDSIQALLDTSQRWMAEQTARLHQALLGSGTRLWLVGYSELKHNGVFTAYKQTLQDAYRITRGEGGSQMIAGWDSVLVFQHFSMNCFLIDLKRALQTDIEQDIASALTRLGTTRRKQIFES